MKSDPTHLLSVSRATMGPQEGMAVDVRIKCESAVIPPLMADDDVSPVVDEVPSEAFIWSWREDELLFGAYAAAQHISRRCS